MTGSSAITCPGCGSEEHRAELTGREPVTDDAFDVVRCAGCGLAFVAPLPDAGTLARYYSEEYYGNRHPFLERLLMGLRARKLGPASLGARVLDIGCGTGGFLAACRRRGWRVTGVERPGSPALARRAARGFEIVAPEEIASLPDASFGAVTLWHVLEHLPDPRATLGEAHRLLAAGGRLLVEVPNFGGWQARIGRERWFHLDLPRHLTHFDRSSLASLLAACGFRPERQGTFSLEYDAFGLAQTLLNRLTGRPNVLFQRLIGRPVDRGLADLLPSALLAVPVGALSTLVSFLAPLVGQGGVVRVLARRLP